MDVSMKVEKAVSTARALVEYYEACGHVPPQENHAEVIEAVRILVEVYDIQRARMCTYCKMMVGNPPCKRCPWYGPEAVASVMVDGPSPEIICLCGSTRFYNAFQQANYEQTMQGKIVLSVGFYPHAQEQAHGQVVGCTAEQKAALDDLHKRKIDLADSVLVLNVGGYIGESTRSEIVYAKAHGKPVHYLEGPEPGGEKYDAR